MTGICGGDIKTLSAATLVKNFYDYEKTHGSIIKGALSRKIPAEQQALEEKYKDLTELRQHFKNQSVWRVRSGMTDLVNKLVDKLDSEKNVRILLNESVENLEFNKLNKNNGQIQVKSANSVENVDLVISTVYTKCKKILFRYQTLKFL